MNLYSKKQRWKIVLVAIALLIVAGTIWYASHITEKVRAKERQDIKLWSEAIRKKADLVNVTNQSFETLAEVERQRVTVWGKAIAELNREGIEDYSFAMDIMNIHSTFPIILTDQDDNIITVRNLDGVSNEEIKGKLSEWAEENPPVIVSYSSVGSQKIYYRNSDAYYSLLSRTDSLIEAFNVDLVENSAQVPVIFIDAQTNELIATNLSEEEVSDKKKMDLRIQQMKAEVGDPIEVNLKDNEKGFVYYQDSMTLKQLKYFPYIMLGIISLFLVVGYFLFSTFRRAEQNQVWGRDGQGDGAPVGDAPFITYGMA